MPYAFVSYSHADSATVYPVIRQLARMGCLVWYDEGIPVIADYGSTLYNKIMDCSVFVIFKSKRSVASEDVRKEIHHAIEFRKKILQVIIDEDAKYTPDIAYHVLPTWQHVSIRADATDFYRKRKNISQGTATVGRSRMFMLTIQTGGGSVHPVPEVIPQRMSVSTATSTTKEVTSVLVKALSAPS